MTEPTWKDPLLAEWWKGCSEETRALYAPVPSAPATDLLLGFAETKQTVGLPDCAYHDARRLRSLIDAELARGREAVERVALLEKENAALANDLRDYHADRVEEKYP